jgi:hypothetical protein
MSTTLTNEYLNNFDDKLKTYNSIFFKTITTRDTLLPEVDTITKPDNSLNISASSDTYNIAQFNNFIRNIINFKIKNGDELSPTDTNMNFINKTIVNGNPTFSFNTNVRDNIIETLKVINVFVDILEAYKNCIENEGNPLFDSGYTKDKNIDIIQLVSDTIRIYDGTPTTFMYPDKDTKNAGYIRGVTFNENGTSINKNILYLSIRSFNMTSYDDVFTRTGSTKDHIASIFTSAKTGKTDLSGLLLEPTINYQKQEYISQTTYPSSLINLTLTVRNKALVTILLKTLFDLDFAFRKQSVYALYFYYKFVQLYSCLIINVSNVMYANVSNNTINCINIYNTTKYEYVSDIKVTRAGAGYKPNYSSTTTITYSGGSAVFTPSTGVHGAIPTSTVINVNNSPWTEIDTNPIYDPTTKLWSVAAVTFDPPIVAGTQPSIIVEFKGKYNPLIIYTNNVTNNHNIDRLTTVIDNISTEVIKMNGEMTKYSQNNDDNSFEFTSTTPATVTLIDGAAQTGGRVIINITDTNKTKILSTYNYSYDLINDYCVYDNKNRLYYHILEINDLSLATPPSFEIKINAVLVVSDLKKVETEDPSTVLFKNKDGNLLTTGGTINNTTGKFLDIRKKDINAFKDEYDNNKKTINKLNSEIGLNTNKVQRQKNLYDNQYNKNVFLTRQILIYNIIISIIVLILIFINLMKLDKQLAKTISLSCFGAIILLFVIYVTSNITYIETFTGSEINTPSSILHTLTKTYYDSNMSGSITNYNNNKKDKLNYHINELNKKFISYFEKIIITIPSADSVDFYREIKETTNSEIDNKSYISELLIFNNSQGNNDMDTIKYEIENNKLYILTLLISSIIFIGFYNMYINYNVSEKYISLIVFICIIIFIIISAYYIINSNKRVRTVYKHKYWGPETSKNF